MADELKPSEACKLAGLKSLNELSYETKEPVSNLIHWFSERPRRFRMMLEASVIARMNRNLQIIRDAMPLDEEKYKPDRKADSHVKRKQT